MSGAETTVSDDWIASTLASDSGIATAFGDFSVAVFDALAPPDAPYPFIVWQCQAPSDVVGVGPKARIMVKADYIVRVVMRVDSYRDPLMVAIAQAIDDALDGAKGTATGGAVLGCQRQDEYRSIENADGRQIRHLGGRYTVHVQST